MLSCTHDKSPSPKNGWTSSVQCYQFTMENVSIYFVSRLVSDGNAANDYKNLKKNGHIPFLKLDIFNQLLLYKNNKCICLPEIKKDILYRVKIWMVQVI